MQCPKCLNVELKKSRVKQTGTVIDRCLSCGGIWFDGGELEAVMKEAVKDLKVSPLAKESPFRFCPHCGAGLFEIQYPQTLVKVDVCKKCHGLWVDAGEFQEIKTVRRALEQKGKLGGKKEDYPEPTGIKGGLLKFIDTAIDALLDGLF